MPRKPADVTDAELAILQVLWESPATIREITDQIYPDGSESQYATVKKLLARLDEKGLVDRDKSRMAHLFAAKITQDELIERRLRDVAEDICNGSHTPLLMNLLRNRKYSARERRELHDLFDDLFGDSPKKSKRKGPSND